MQRPSIPYAAARIFALENKLLSRDRIERMVEAHSPDDVLRILGETDYGLGIAELSSANDYEDFLSSELERIFEFFKIVSPNLDITDLFFLKYDFHNLKVLLKNRYLTRSQEDLLVRGVGTLELELLEDAIEEEDYSSLPNYLKEVLEEIDRAMEIRLDPQKISILLDKAMYEEIFRVLSPRKYEVVLNYFKIQVDLINIRTFLRVRAIDETYEFFINLFLPNSHLNEEFFYEIMEEPIENLSQKFSDTDYSLILLRGLDEYIRTGSLSAYERLMDDYLLNYVRKVRWNPLGLEPIIGYLLAKENELKLIRIIMVGKINNLSSEIIRERLRDVYV